MMRFDEALIELVRQNPVLYDMSHKSHSDIPLREELWRQIGEALNKPALDCKHRWIALRDQMRKHVMRERRFEKELGTRSISSNNNNNNGTTRFPKRYWRYEENMAFIIPFYRDRDTTSSLSGSFSGGIDAPSDSQGTTTTSNITEDVDELTVDSIEILPVQTTLAVESSPITSNKRFRLESTTTDNLECSSTEQSGRHLLFDSTTSSSGGVDAVGSFFNAMAATVRQFSPRRQHLAKRRVFEIIATLELEHLDECGRS